jgi:RNA-dependent RNA polymerase
MCNIAFTVTREELTIEFAKILHKPPFSTSTLLNFEVHIFHKQHPKGKQGILTLPTYDAGRSLLRDYNARITVKGRTIFLCKSR